MPGFISKRILPTTVCSFEERLRCENLLHKGTKTVNWQLWYKELHCSLAFTSRQKQFLMVSDLRAFTITKLDRYNLLVFKSPSFPFSGVCSLYFPWLAHVLHGLFFSIINVVKKEITRRQTFLNHHRINSTYTLICREQSTHSYKQNTFQYNLMAYICIYISFKYSISA